jgi:hypothetical protein
MWMGNGMYDPNDLCRLYNGGGATYRKVYYPSLGIFVCAPMYVSNMFYTYGTPNYYGGQSDIFHGCIVTPQNRACVSLGGTLGWQHKGQPLGVYVQKK